MKWRRGGATCRFQRPERYRDGVRFAAGPERSGRAIRTPAAAPVLGRSGPPVPPSPGLSVIGVPRRGPSRAHSCSRHDRLHVLVGGVRVDLVEHGAVRPAAQCHQRAAVDAGDREPGREAVPEAVRVDPREARPLARGHERLPEFLPRLRGVGGRGEDPAARGLAGFLVDQVQLGPKDGVERHRPLAPGLGPEPDLRLRADDERAELPLVPADVLPPAREDLVPAGAQVQRIPLNFGCVKRCFLC